MVLHGGYVYRTENRDFSLLDAWIVPGLIDVHTHGRVGVDFVASATATPARQIGIYDSVGSIDIGKQADLLLLKNPERLIPEKILLRGKWLSSKSENVTP